VAERIDEAIAWRAALNDGVGGLEHVTLGSQQAKNLEGPRLSRAPAVATGGQDAH